MKRVRTKKDAREAEWLFSLAYDYLRGTSSSAFLKRVRQRDASGGGARV